MLTLPESVADAITPEITKEEIREIKQEIREEEKITDIEVCIEKTDHPEADDGNTLTELIKNYLKEYPKEFKALAENGNTRAVDVLAPSGSAVIMARVPGIGRMMITLEDGQPAKLVNVRANTTEEFSDEQLEEAVRKIFDSVAAGSAEEAYKELYGEEMPKEPVKAPETKKSPEKKKVKIAPAQTKKEKNPKPANADFQSESKAVTPEESQENTEPVKTEEPANADFQSETRETTKEESEGNQRFDGMPEPANPDKQSETQTIKVTKSIPMIVEETKDTAKELKAELEVVERLEEFTPAARLEDIIAKIQELSVSFLCNLQNWKKAAEREDLC